MNKNLFLNEKPIRIKKILRNSFSLRTFIKEIKFKKSEQA
jgi:hypothetical protein